MQRKAFLEKLRDLLRQFPIVGLIGPRQVGKTTLAHQFSQKAHYLDLEKPSDLAKFESPQLFLQSLEGLIVIDEIQRKPELFPILRALVDEDSKKKARQYLILGSASPELLKQSTESLAGRIAFLELPPFSLAEIKEESKLHLRGGFPLSYLSKSERESFRWREQYLTAFLERDLPQLGIQIPSLQIRRFWMMLCHYHGQIWNGSEIGNSLQITHTTARRYLDILIQTFMVRELQPWFANISKRQVKSPKIYIRDSGIFHALTNIETKTDLLHHSRLGASWEGFALENIIQRLGVASHQCYFWAIHSQAEIDLIVKTKRGLVGFEIKYTDKPSITNSLKIALEYLDLLKAFVISPGQNFFPLAKNVTAVGLSSLEKIKI